MSLNERAAALATAMTADAERLRISVEERPCGARVIDCGISAKGGLEAGVRLAEVCLAGLGHVRLVRPSGDVFNGPWVLVTTDHPVAACMASQYAGWQVSLGKYFAIASGPMRAAAAKETLFKAIGCTEKSAVAVGVLETRKLPPDEVCEKIASDCAVDPRKLTLLVAPSASQAGTVQVVARSIETAMHKLFELDFDLNRVESGWGLAPLAPVAADDLAAIGRANDAILYGAEVTLWVRGDDPSLEAVGPKIPSCASSDFGEPFSTIFERYERDFYKIDPHLFSPAVVTLSNLDTGRSFSFGQTRADVIRKSFGNE